MNAEEVLRMRLDLQQRMRDREFRAYIHFAMREQYLNRKDTTDKLPTILTEALTMVVNNADMYRVTEDMSMLVQFAASKLDEEDTYDRMNLPSPWGIVRFERPLKVNEVRGGYMLAHWMTWGPIPAQTDQSVTMFTFWNDPVTEPDEQWLKVAEEYGQDETFRRLAGRWAFIGAEMIKNGASLGPAEVEVSPQELQQLHEEGVEAPAPFTNCRRYAHALLLLLNQTVTSTAEEQPRSAMRKRLTRMRLPDKVTVIMLRRTESKAAHGESLVEWSHRWLVKGHWRWQACGKNREERTRIWINGYVKGPEDKPLIVTDKVYQLSR